eukprot:scaffold6299_cov107-Cylindrotheca_fusiformis.AAC.5
MAGKARNQPSSILPNAKFFGPIGHNGPSESVLKVNLCSDSTCIAINTGCKSFIGVRYCNRAHHCTF